MFIYKYCPNCQKRNHKTNSLCTRCGDELLNDAKFGKNVFAVTLSVIILLSSATVFASNSYFNKKSDNNNQPNTQVPNVEPKQEEVKPATSQVPTTDETASEPAVKSPVSKETVAAPQTTTPVVTTPVTSSPVVPPTLTTPAPEPIAKTCDVNAKANYLAWYDEKISAENDRYNQEVRDIKADFSRRGIWGDCSEGLCKAAVDQATATHNHNINNISYWLQSSLSSINCSN